MERQQCDWTTIDLIWRESAHVFHARNPFPPGGVVEDPATGAAAAAFGGYLRELGLVTPPATVTVHQGQDLGRPSDSSRTPRPTTHLGQANLCPTAMRDGAMLVRREQTGCTC
jgi:predicted PhzF superfamily epimerase YddE/YHI9